MEREHTAAQMERRRLTTGRATDCEAAAGRGADLSPTKEATREAETVLVAMAREWLVRVRKRVERGSGVGDSKTDWGESKWVALGIAALCFW